MMNTISVRCQQCGAPISETNKFCSQCGSPIVVLDDTTKLQYTYQKVDDARIREADVRESIRLKELEIELLKLQHSTKQERFGAAMRFVSVVVYFVLLAAMLLISTFSSNENVDYLRFYLLLLIPLGFAVVFVAFRKK